jgi:multiple sugar transport system permease protein
MATSRLGRLGWAAGVLGVLLALLFPFLWMVLTSLKAPGELFASGFPAFVPQSLSMDVVRGQLQVPAKVEVEVQALLQVELARGVRPLQDPADREAFLQELRKDKRRQAMTELTDALAAQPGLVRFHADALVDPPQVEATIDRRVLTAAALTELLATKGCSLVGAPECHPYPVGSEYGAVFDKIPFAGYLYNSFMIASLTTGLCLAVGTLCAFALARLQFRGRDALLALILAVSMFPPIAVVSPLFLLLKRLHMLNTWLALIMPYTAFGLPLTVWTLHAFLRQIPRELDESARVDGCTRLQALVRVLLPVAAPGLFTCAILVFIAAWNEFLFGLVFITKDTLRTVPVGIMLLPGQYEMPWTTVFAAATIVTLPLVLVVLVFQKRLVEGLTAGAVKG